MARNPTDEATRLAQAALRGFFDDPDGFMRMDTVRQRKAVEAVRKVLGVTPAPGKAEQAPVEAEPVERNPAGVDARRFRNVECGDFVEVNVPPGAMPTAYGVPDGSEGDK